MAICQPIRSSSSSSFDIPSEVQPDSSISGLHQKHQRDLENLTLTSQPLKTLKCFILAVIIYLQRPLFWLFACRGWFMFLVIPAGVIVTAIATGSMTNEAHVQELLCYLRFGLWWLSLGVASSIGLGSGLHTFVLYLGPHIALFTIKAVRCGRIDIKSAPYDTIQLSSGPSWLDRDCSEYGPPVYLSRVPLSSILHQVQLEAILWGIGTALGEIPPYFISRAASTSRSKQDITGELDSSSKEDSGIISNHLKQMRKWLLSHSQYLNFFTILVLAAVPNPLFDLAGIMCGQLGVPFWEFFSATLIGKAIIKTHIQTTFIISICNNQLDLIENKLIRMLGFVPGLSSILPNLTAKLDIIKEKYLTASPTALTSNIKVKKWDLSFALIWNTIIWLMLLNFAIQIVTATAKSFLREQQKKELATLANNLSISEATTYNLSQSSSD